MTKAKRASAAAPKDAAPAIECPKCGQGYTAEAVRKAGKRLECATPACGKVIFDKRDRDDS